MKATSDASAGEKRETVEWASVAPAATSATSNGRSAFAFSCAKATAVDTASAFRAVPSELVRSVSSDEVPISDWVRIWPSSSYS